MVHKINVPALLWLNPLNAETIWGIPLAKAGDAFKFLRMQSSQLTQYIPVLMLGVLAVGFAFGMLILSVVVGKRGKRLPIKDTAYECGMLPIGEGSSRLSVKFYLVAMLFILFDIEVVFLYPWAVVYKDMLKDNAAVIFGSMISFMVILFVGYIYALKKRAFDWKG
jgi:NADH-quinone oxidoreductase subunit A